MFGGVTTCSFSFTTNPCVSKCFTPIWLALVATCKISQLSIWSIMFQQEPLQTWTKLQSSKFLESQAKVMYKIGETECYGDKSKCNKDVQYGLQFHIKGWEPTVRLAWKALSQMIKQDEEDKTNPNQDINSPFKSIRHGQKTKEIVIPVDFLAKFTFVPEAM